MSIITKRGDSGETDLMYGKRVSKTHPRIAANGAIDELNSVLGLARWHAGRETPRVGTRLAEIQAQLILLMGEVATASEDRQRYLEDGFKTLVEDDVGRLTSEARAIEADLNTRFDDWATPGSAGPLAAVYLDHARTICRRAERLLAEIDASEERTPSTPRIYLNRLADYLWILARAVERRRLDALHQRRAR